MIYGKYNGTDVSVCIENIDEDDPYTCIGSKAFLSRKNIYEIMLPDTINEIGDWAFAHMKDLKIITVPATKISFGKDVFLDCGNIEEIRIISHKSVNQGLSYLLASCITMLKSNELLDFKYATEDNESWCSMYDRKLLNYLKQNDSSGFQPVIVGWFNDEGEEEQLEQYIGTVRKEKIQLCFLRLKYDFNINIDTRNQIIKYIRQLIPQDNFHANPAWETLKDVLSDDLQYVKASVNNNIFNKEMILELIDHLNTINASTEIISYLVRAFDADNVDIDQQFKL